MYLLDAHSLIFQVFHAVPAMTGPKGQPTNAVFGFTGDLLRLRKRNPDYLIAVFDAPGKTFRDDLYPEYKAHRAPMPDALAQQIPQIFRLLEAMRIPVVRAPGVEADDALATIAVQAEARGLEVFLCSADKDLRQLLTDKVKLYNLRKDLVFDAAALKEDWGITPAQVVDLLALTGDSVDNVPGVPGIGPKTAQKLLNEYGSVDAIVQALPTMRAGKVRDNLQNHAASLELSRKLVLLERNVPLDIDWEGWRLQPWDTAALLAFFQECGFHRYAQEVRAAPAPKKAAQMELFPTAKAPWDGKYENVDTPERFAALVAELSKVPRLAVDLETTSLEPTQADVVGYALCWKDKEACYVPVRGPAGQNVLDPGQVRDALRPILENPAIAKINQNIKYDLLVLRRAGVRIQGIAGDPMLASYLLTSGERNHNLDELSLRYLNHEPISITSLIGKGKSQKRMDEVDTAKVAEYAAEDADLAWRLCKLLEDQVRMEGLDKLYRDLELPLVEVLAELEWNGIKVDVPRLRTMSEEFATQIAVLVKEIEALAGHPFNIDSPIQLRKVLFEELKLPTQRKTAVKGEASTGADVLEDLAALGHQLPRKILEYRQLTKLKGTYIDTLPELVNPETGRVHASFNQTVAATGRLSSSDPNLQNIPVRSDLGRQIRQAFVPGEPGWVLLTADYSQIELRVLAHYSQDEVLQRAFREDRDIHTYVAAQIYNVAEDQVTDAQRRNAKTVNFGVIYGLSAFGLSKRLGISNEEAEQFIDAYFARYPGVLKFQEQLLADARRDGFVTTVLGRRRMVSGIRPNSSYRQRNQAEREALNTVIQGSAADLIKQAMLNLHRRLAREQLPARMLLQIHDELVFEVPPATLQPLAAVVAHEMTQALPLQVPLKVDVSAGPNWLDVEPVAA